MTEDFTAPAVTTPYPSEPVIVAAPVTTSPDSPSTTEVAKEQAASVGQGAAEAGQHVAGVTKEQAANVAAEASKQAKDLFSQTRSELQEQAVSQQRRIAAGIRSLGDELGSMAANSEQSGTASQLAQQASQRAGVLAGWLDERDPGSLVQELTSFARRRPGTFLAIAAGAGLLAGRLTRGAVDAARDDSNDAESAVPDESPYGGVAPAESPYSTRVPGDVNLARTPAVEVEPEDEPRLYEPAGSVEGQVGR